MTDAELAHAWWGWFWTTIEHAAFVGLIIALAIEFLALKLAEPHKKIVEDAKDLKNCKFEQKDGAVTRKRVID